MKNPMRFSIALISLARVFALYAGDALDSADGAELTPRHSAAAAVADAAVAATPTTGVTPNEVKPTPGRAVSLEQAATLTYEKAVEIFDKSIVDAWKIDWPVFQSQTLSFDHAQKRLQLRQLISRLNEQERITLEQQAFYGKVFGLKNSMEAAHAERLGELATNYFKGTFPNAAIESESKLAGVQLGRRINVVRPNHPRLTYHVKTHSEGRLASKSTAAKLVDPRELMVYKVLEHLEVGCEARFFGRSAEDVYIATLDAGTNGAFDLFEKISSDKDEGYARDTAGVLAGISKNPRELPLVEIEASIAGDAVAQNFIAQMATLDIITRVLKLCDLLNNPANFGFFKSDDGFAAIKVIDFRVIDDPFYRQDNYNPFGGFLIGNGLYRYVGSHKTMRYVLHDRPQAARMATAKQIMSDTFKIKTRVAIERANREVGRFIQENAFFSKHAESMNGSLAEYYREVTDNIEEFSHKLMGWTPEGESRSE